MVDIFCMNALQDLELCKINILKYKATKVFAIIPKKPNYRFVIMRNLMLLIIEIYSNFFQLFFKIQLEICE